MGVNPNHPVIRSLPWWPLGIPHDLRVRPNWWSADVFWNLEEPLGQRCTCGSSGSFCASTMVVEHNSNFTRDFWWIYLWYIYDVNYKVYKPLTGHPPCPVPQALRQGFVERIPGVTTLVKDPVSGDLRARSGNQVRSRCFFRPQKSVTLWRPPVAPFWFGHIYIYMM